MIHFRNAFSDLKDLLCDGSYIFLGLDYDGTLTELVSSPEEGILLDSRRLALKALITSVKVTPSIISGRSLQNLRDKVILNNIILAGDHGVEIAGPLIEFTHHEAKTFKEFLEGLIPKISFIVSLFPGALFEIKPYTLSVHYRLISLRDRKSLLAKLRIYLKPFLENRLCRRKWGKEILNIVMPFDWDKGHAFSLLLAQLQANYPKKLIIPIYIGDDISDEDAFRVARIKGYAVRVGKPKKNTLAQFFVDSPNEVESFLFNLSEWVKN
jgi:trehalose-phosphatase